MLKAFLDRIKASKDRHIAILHLLFQMINLRFYLGSFFILTCHIIILCQIIHYIDVVIGMLAFNLCNDIQRMLMQ